MTLTLFVGASLVAMGPSLVLFFMLVSKNDQMVILSIGSAFFWLLAVTVSSFIWWAAVPIQRVNVAHVLIAWPLQELFRWVFYLLYVKAEKVLQPGQSSLSNRLLASLATGVGTSLMYSFVMFSSVLWKMTGPGALFSGSCPGTNLFLVNSLMAFCFAALHIAWALLSFDAYRQLSTKAGKLMLAGVLASHLFASLASQLNYMFPAGSCAAGVSVTFFITLLTVAAAAYNTHKSLSAYR